MPQTYRRLAWSQDHTPNDRTERRGRSTAPESAKRVGPPASAPVIGSVQRVPTALHEKPSKPQMARMYTDIAQSWNCPSVPILVIRGQRSECLSTVDVFVTGS